MALIGVFSPETQSELAVVLALLEAHDIPCFVHGRFVAGLYPGLQINAFNTQRVLVPEEHVPDAAELLQEFRESTRADHTGGMSWSDKARVVFEVIVAGWFVPGRKLALSDGRDEAMVDDGE